MRAAHPGKHLTLWCKLKRLIKPVRGCNTLKTAYTTIKGVDVMRALRKGQASAFHLTRDMRSEARLAERVFSVGGEIGSEPEAPLSDAFVDGAGAALSQDQLHVAQAQAEYVVQLDSAADDLGREAIAAVRDRIGRHPASLAQPLRPGQEQPT